MADFSDLSVASVMTSVPRPAGRWMSVRYGDSWLARQWRRRSAVSSELTDLVCQKFVDFYLEQCKQEIVRDRRLVVHVIIDIQGTVIS